MLCSTLPYTGGILAAWLLSINDLICMKHIFIVTTVYCVQYSARHAIAYVTRDATLRYKL